MTNNDSEMTYEKARETVALYGEPIHNEPMDFKKFKEFYFAKGFIEGYEQSRRKEHEIYPSSTLKRYFDWGKNEAHDQLSKQLEKEREIIRGAYVALKTMSDKSILRKEDRDLIDEALSKIPKDLQENLGSGE